MVGIVVDGPAYILGCNQSVLCNTTIIDSMLNNEVKSIAYPIVREGAERYACRTPSVNTHDKLTDILTNVLPMSEKRPGFS